MAKVHEDIKDGSNIIFCEITERNFLRGKRKNAKQFMNVILHYRQWKHNIMGWYQFRTKWYFKGTSIFLRSRMSISPAYKLNKMVGLKNTENIIHVKIVPYAEIGASFQQ